MSSSKTKLMIVVAILVVAGALIYSKHRSMVKQSAQEQQLTQSAWKNDNVFDVSIIRFCQNFSRKSRVIDETLGFISANNLLKCGLLTIAFWWLWFSSNGAKEYRQRISVMLTLMGTSIALIIGRLIVLGLPFRVRPMKDDTFHLLVPYGVHIESLDGYSSFPSDHTILLCAMAAGLYLTSKKVGILAFVYALGLVVLPRIYLCYHYPTDVLAGMFIGILVVWLTFKSKWMQAQAERICRFSKENPAVFYSIFFLVTCQIANLFEDVRTTITFLTQELFH